MSLVDPSKHSIVTVVTNISSRLLSLIEVLALSMMATNKCPKKKKGGCICPICEESIDDKLQQSIFCEGTCDSWLHRCCAGLSRAAFSKLEGSTEKFSCPCRLHDQAIEISSLKESLASLQRDVAALQELQSMGNQSVVSSPEEPVSSNPRGSLPSTRQPPRTHGSDRNFNLIVSGIEESAPGTTRRDRLAHDNNKLSTLLSFLLPNFSDQSVRDCSRLGRYLRDRTRPLLVVLNRSCDVSTVLSNKSRLADRPNIKINRDLSPSLRKTRSVLLTQRRHLISSGIDRSNIKIGKNELYVNGHKHGLVVGHEYKLVSVQSQSESFTNSTLTTPSSPQTGSGTDRVPAAVQESS